MDTRTGEIHEMDGSVIHNLKKKGVIIEADPMSMFMSAMSHVHGGKPSDYVPVEGKPDPDCSKCNGTGAVPKGLRSKRFKPCLCTKVAKRNDE